MLSEGIFNMTKSKEDRIRTIEEFSGPLKKGAIEILDTEWGTAENFENRGEKRGKKEGIEEATEKIVYLLKKQGKSDDEIRKELKEVGLAFD